MRPATTLTAFAGALALVFGAALGVGHLVGPIGTAAASTSETDGASVAALPGGLSVSQDGYSLQLARTTQAPGVTAPLRFAIAGPDGERVTRFVRTHDKDLHLIVVRRDLTGFQHLHPERDAEGRWSVPLLLPAAGSWKVIADFVPEGHDGALALAADLTAPGATTAAALPAASRAAMVDGYEVRLEGDLVAGSTSRLTFTVRRNGRAVPDLAPYLGAYGHLVALRVGDLAYLHVHPEMASAADPLVFDADVPAPAVHRLFLQFSHDGTVHTAAFTVTATQGPAPGAPSHGHDSEEHQ